MNTLTNSDIPVLNPQVVYHLPKELAGTFAAGRVRRGKVRRVLHEGRKGITPEEVLRQMWRAAGY